MDKAISINKTLAGKLNPAHIATRKQGGRDVAYIEGWYVISEANRIFGFDGWDMETIYNQEVSRETNANGNNVVGYTAKVRITVKSEKFATETIREGTGAGSGIAKTLFDAIEGASKEAETDAMKRAFKSFGNLFGLALYDKTQAGVGMDAPQYTVYMQGKDIFTGEANEAIKKMAEIIKGQPYLEDRHAIINENPEIMEMLKAGGGQKTIKRLQDLANEGESKEPADDLPI